MVLQTYPWTGPADKSDLKHLLLIETHCRFYTGYIQTQMRTAGQAKLVFWHDIRFQFFGLVDVRLGIHFHHFLNERRTDYSQGFITQQLCTVVKHTGMRNNRAKKGLQQ